jgi:phosphoribosylformylglycinamidine synthase
MDLPVRRIERSQRLVCSEANKDSIIAAHLDPMTQEVYASAFTMFDTGMRPEPVAFVDILGRGKTAMREANVALGLGMDDWDETYWTALFVRLGRNPTNVELFQIGNGNSEHSRHWFFRGIHVIDGVELPESLMAIVQAPWKCAPGNSLVAFRDNAGVIRGTDVPAFVAEYPGHPSALALLQLLQHITATAETHNHPTLVAPFPGAATGTGGRIRDNRAVGRGGLVHAGLAGYCVGNLHISGYAIPGENVGGEVSRRHASPLDILIQGSNGISNYGNEIGEPLIGGFCRSFGQMIGDLRREFRKPVLYSAGMGRLFDQHVSKRSPEKGMLIVRIGGPAFRIGVGGGSASSMIHGAQDEGLDLSPCSAATPRWRTGSTG